MEQVGSWTVRDFPGRCPLIVLFALVSTSACAEQPLSPTQLRDSTALGDSAAATDPEATRTPHSLINDRAWIVDPAITPLVSTAAEHAAGTFRFRDDNGYMESIRRDDVILASIDNERVPRRVLRVHTENSDRIFDTGPALWSDVVNSGRYGLTTSLVTGASTTLAGEIMTVRGATPLPALGGPFEVDLCAVVDSIAQDGTQLCDKEQDIDKTVKGVEIRLAGTLDSLALLDGDMNVTGSAALEMTIDGGGASGGTPPVFAPCNAAAYPGCLKTPTGAAWIDWLRRYAPNIPEASLRPARVCVPGSPIRTRAGRWEGLRWIPPQYQPCTITSIGQLPTVTRPSLQGMSATIQPRITGGMTLYAEGDGRLGLRVPIPKLALQRGEEGEGIEAELTAGMFIDVELTVRNTSGWARGELDEELRITQTWSPGSGWTVQSESIRSTQTFDYGFGNPDSLTVKVFLPLYAFKLSATFKPEGAGFEIEAEEGVEFGPFAEVFWSREQVHPNDPDIDNWHIRDEKAYEIKPSAGVELPEEFQIPNVETSWSPTYEFGRVRNGDTWGLANLIVETNTTGTNIDADGYTVIVNRADTLPMIIQQGAIREGDARDHGTTMERAIGATETLVFERPYPGCGIAYSDAQGSHAKSIVRKVGFTLPTYALVSRDCNLLVARHRVQLSGVAANCTVEDGAVRDSVWLLQRRFGFDERNDTTRVVFNVQCGTTTPMGAIAVTVTAPLPSTSMLELRHNGVPVGLVAPGETRVLSGITAGSGHVLSLHGVPSLCASSPETVNVVADQTTNISLFVFCAEFQPAPGTVLVKLNHAGVVPQAQFNLVVDGTPRAAMASGSQVTIEGLAPNTMSTLLLTGLPGNCRVTSMNPQGVGAQGTTAIFSTGCIAASIDTLQGTITATAFPLPGASLQTLGGQSVALTGSLFHELRQLGGATVRLHGVKLGSSIDVYGYTLVSTTTEPRWVGIVTQRDGKLWLFGEQAVELVDAPPALAALVGAYVWVSGNELSQQPLRVAPSMYGLIRGALP